MLLPFSPELLLRLLHQRRRLHTKLSLHSKNVWQLLGVCCVRGPDLIANLSDGLKIIDPGFITCDDIGKMLFVIFWKHLKQLFLATLTRCLLCSSVNRCGIHVAEIFLTFKCFFKIRWTVENDMPIFRAISQTVNLASLLMISSILEMISLQDADFGLPDFGWTLLIFDRLYTRLKFLFPPPNCVIRHTRRSTSSTNFSHQLLRRTTKF